MKEPARTFLKEILTKVAYDYEMMIDEIEIPPDHIHMIIQAPPKLSPSKIMQILKSKSAIEFFKVYPKIKKAYFWWWKLWTESFFVETIWNRNEDQVRKYVQEQLKHEEETLKQMPNLMNHLQTSLF